MTRGRPPQQSGRGLDQRPMECCGLGNGSLELAIPQSHGVAYQDEELDKWQRCCANRQCVPAAQALGYDFTKDDDCSGAIRSSATGGRRLTPRLAAKVGLVSLVSAGRLNEPGVSHW